MQNVKIKLIGLVMKKSLAKDLLEHLIVCGGSLLVSGLFLPYGVSLGSSIRQLEKVVSRCTHDFSLRSHNTISTTLHRLKQQGFVKNRGPKKKTIWHVTKKGSQRLMMVNLELPKQDGRKRLVVFDIPEKERYKRGWLRAQLRVYEFKPLQRSVWLGTRPFLPNFLNDVERLGISDRVLIFSLGRKAGVVSK